MASRNASCLSTFSRVNDSRIDAIKYFIFLISCLILVLPDASNANSNGKKGHCYSCASENMKENFLTRTRGPPNRLNEPKIYDNLCDLDAWMIREKSAEECDGACFKWQQILNNSGVLSYATIRGCHTKIFGPNAPPFGDVDDDGNTPSNAMSRSMKALSECHTTTTQLSCIDQSQLEEHFCYCQSTYCNVAATTRRSLAILLNIILTIILLRFS